MQEAPKKDVSFGVKLFAFVGVVLILTTATILVASFVMWRLSWLDWETARMIIAFWSVLTAVKICC